MNYKIKEGFTFIELIVCLAVILILNSILVPNCLKLYKKVSNSVQKDYVSNKILYMINDAVQYCSIKKQSGKLIFDTEKQKIKFYFSGSVVKSYKFPKGFELKHINEADGHQYIKISEKDIQNCSISYLDKEKKEHTISIRVGSNYVKIKN